MRLKTRRLRSFVWPWGFVLMPLGLLPLLLPTIAPGVTFSDGGEIATAIVTLGVIHPTGYPIFTVLAHLFQRLPTPFEPVVEISVLNCLFAAISAVLVALTVRDLVRPMEAAIERKRPIHRSEANAPAPWIGELAGLVAGFATGIAPQLWAEVRIPEVYPFHMVLTTAALYVWSRFGTTGDPKYIVWAALPMGIGLAHHVTMVYMLPAAAVFVLVRRPTFFAAWLVVPIRRILHVWRRRSDPPTRGNWPKSWMFPVACLIGAAPLLTYGYLLWATSHTTGVPWGGIDNWDRLVNHVTGRQYRHFMMGFGYEKIPQRLASLPAFLRGQFLVAGVVFAAVGLLSTLRHAAAYTVFLVLLAGANLAHALQYGVGNYLDYSLPALAAVAILIGIGLWRIGVILRGGLLGRHWWSIIGVGSILVALFAWQLHDIATHSGRTVLTLRHADIVVAGSSTLALLGWMVPLAVKVRKRGQLRGSRSRMLAVYFFVLVGSLYATLGVLRAVDRLDFRVIGDKHAAGVAREIPPGGVYMTMGDGFVFTTYYYQHVLGQGIDTAMIKLRGPNSRWYRDLYMRSRHPRDCDPIWGTYARDESLYEKKCGTFADRMALPDQPSWVKITAPLNRWAPIRGAEAKTKFRAEGPPIRRGNHRRCKNPAYRGQHRDDCECWDYYDRPHRYDMKCVHAAEEDGIVPRSKIEIQAHTIIEDHIHERPVFERNIFTAWSGKGKNKRGWTGPSRLRPSGDYALINRGRTNQVVLSKDIEGFDPCAFDRLKRVPTPHLRPATDRPLRRGQRKSYRPNEWPTLLKFTYLSPKPRGDSDDGTTNFRPGQDVYLHLEWLERRHYDPAKKGRRGRPLHHGVRLCAFDDEGNRIWLDTVASGTHASRALRIPLSASASTGRYTIQGCTVGEVDPGEPIDDACRRPILEADFDVRTSP